LLVAAAAAAFGDVDVVALLALQGLIMYNITSKQVELLSHRVSRSSPMQPDTPITYANDLDIASDGTIYFTDSVNITTHR
jgi:sugar lactone lactonase YvrE